MLQVDKYLITTPLLTILQRIQKDLNGFKLKDIQSKGDNIQVTCPNHKNGVEQHPSCSIYVGDSKIVTYGTVHCFTCGYRASFINFVSLCYNIAEDEAKQWLIDNFDTTVNTNISSLEPIIFDVKELKSNFAVEDLNQYDYYHPYMFERHLSKEVIDRFRIGYDKRIQAITFPVYDEKGKLVMVTKRSVLSKRFYIPSGVDKPVYLLNEAIKNNLTTVYVTESQINALTLYTFGYPAIALFGTGSEYQYNILRKSGIRNYILCFDGDAAGKKGELRFKQNLGNDIIISVKHLPPGKDVNDLTKEEFDNLEITS